MGGGEMKKFEERTGKQAIYWTAFGPEISQEYIDEIEAKATAYDRLMSMNSVSKNDIEIVLDGDAWCAYRKPFRNLQEDDAGFGDTPQTALTALLESELPDGWEEK
jgi:hypothetical protein